LGGGGSGGIAQTARRGAIATFLVQLDCVGVDRSVSPSSFAFGRVPRRTIRHIRHILSNRHCRQVEPARFGNLSLVDGCAAIARDDGWRGLVRGAQPTVVGYLW